MSSKSSVEEASQLKNPLVSISEPKGSIYVTKQTALEYVKNELEMVKDYRKTSFTKMEESKKTLTKKKQNIMSRWTTLRRPKGDMK